MSSINNIYDLVRGKKTLQTVIKIIDNKYKPKKYKKKKNKNKNIDFKNTSSGIMIDNKYNDNKKLEYPQFGSEYDKYIFQSFRGSKAHYHDKREFD